MMRKTLCYIFLLSFYSFFCFSQQDSLTGFDIVGAQKEAQYHNLTTDENSFFINQQKRKFIKEKHHLQTHQHQNSLSYSANMMPATNLDFESGNFSGWTLYHGLNANSIDMSDDGFAIGGNLSIVTSGTDPTVSIPLVSPLGGTKVARVHFTQVAAYQSKIRNTINVTPKNNLLKFAYATVLQKTNHPGCYEQPSFAVLLKDTTGHLLFKFLVQAPDTLFAGNCSGHNQANHINTSISCYYSNWATKCVDLTPYIGRNIIIDVIASSCIHGGHWGYGYFDAKLETCPDHGNPNTLLINSQPIDLSANFMHYFNSNCTSSSVSITAPSWSSYVNWNGPSGSGIYTSSLQTINANFNGLYTLGIGNNSVCPITKSFFLTANTQPTITSSITNSNICVNSSLTITLSGAESYTWSNNTTGPTIIITPTSIGVYTVSAICTTSNGCSVTKTYTFNCNSLPILSITGNTNICSANNPTLVASGAVSYVWVSSTFTTSGATLNSALPTNTVRLTGTDVNGCKSSFVQTLDISTPITTIFTNISNTVNLCLGGYALLYVSGPANTTPINTYTLYSASGSYTFNGGTTPSVITPTISTNYTLSAGNHCPAYNHTFAINVNTYVPALTVTPVSPYCSTNLTLNLSGADTYTINAGFFSSYYLVGNTAVISNASNTVIVHGTYTTSMCSNSQTLYPTLITPMYSLTPLSPICTNSVSTFSVSGSASAYSIVPVNNSAVQLGPTFTASSTFTIIPPVGTTYLNVMGYDPAGCFGTAYIPFSINTPTISSNINGFAANTYTLCDNQTATVSLSGCNTYTWDNSSNSPSVILSPSVSTIYTVQGSNACSTTNQTISITVVSSSLTPVTVSSPTFILCKPYCLTFTASGASSYTWQNNSTAPTILACANNFTNTMSLKYTDINGCKTSTVITYYGYTPTIYILGPDTVCAPSITTFSPGGAVNYTWAVSNSMGTTYSISTNYTLIPHPNIFVTSPYIFTLYGKDGSNCPATLTKTIIVSKQPTIQTNTIITKCFGSIDSLIVLNPAVSVSSFTWNSSLVTNSFVITPTSSTIYTVQSKYNHFGCIATKTLAVNIFTPTIVSHTLSSNQTCEGVPISIVKTPTNAIVSSNGFLSSYFYPMTVGVYTVNCFFVDTNNCKYQSASQSITVHPSPSVSFAISQNNFCQNSNSITLVGSPSGGNFYGDNVVGNTYVPNNSTTCSVIYKYVNGNGCAGFDQQCVTVLPSPVVTASSGSICPGKSFTIIPGGASSYSFSGGNPVSPGTTTTYTVIGSNTTACTATALSTVFVYPSPSVTIVSSMPVLCIGQSASLTASGASSYTWGVGGNTPSIIVTPSVTTNYFVSGANQHDCTFMAVITQSVDACTGGISQIASTLIKVYPNPNSGEFFIESNYDDLLELNIYNPLGQKILEQKITQGKQNVNISNFSSGIYYYTLKGNNSSITGKILKE